MDEPKKLLTLKRALDYLDATHGLRFTVVTMRAKRMKGTGPKFFIPAGMRELRITTQLLDAWVAECITRADERARRKRLARARRSYLANPRKVPARDKWFADLMGRMRIQYIPPPPGGEIYDWSEFGLVVRSRE